MINMAINEKSISDSLLEACSASRALVFLSVPWSVPERLARQEFRIAADLLADQHADLSLRVFMLYEEAEECLAWLNTLGIPQLGGRAARGWGSLLWLEEGKVISSVINATTLGNVGIVSRTISLWRGQA